MIEFFDFVIIFVLLAFLLWRYIFKNIKESAILTRIMGCLGIAISIYVLLVIATNYLPKDHGLTKVIFNGSFALGILAGIPTIYLWSLKEKNKQRELNHIDKTLNHTKEAYFNERLINILSTENLKDEHKIYQLETLLNDWVLHYENDYNNSKLRNIAIQIIGIIFSFERNKTDKINTTLALNTVIKNNLIEPKKCKNWACFNLRKYHFITFNFKYLELYDLNLNYSDLEPIKLNDTTINKCKFKYTSLFFAELKDSQIIDCLFYETNFSHANCSDTTFRGCTFVNIIIGYTIFDNSSFFNCDFSKIDCLIFNDHLDFFKNAKFERCKFDKKHKKIIKNNENLNLIETEWIDCTKGEISK